MLAENKSKSVFDSLLEMRKVKVDIWKDIFEKYFDEKIQKEITNFIKNRNHVAHNKLLTMASYDKMRINILEIQTLFDKAEDAFMSEEPSDEFLFTLWKRVRKYGAYCTGITQNVDDLLQSHTARTMLANSEFIIMLNQASTDRIELAKLLNISDLQMSYITNVGAGQGLLKVGSSLVPFVNKFPKNTELYKLMTTKFGEV